MLHDSVLVKITPRVATAVAVLALVAGCAAGAPAEDEDGARPAGSSSSAAAVTTAEAPPSASAAPVASEPAVPDLTGTAWAGTDSDGDAYVYRFEAGGQFAFTSPSGSYRDAGDVWSQSGDRVTMSVAGGYSTYEGTIQGDTISGTASNVRGHSWTWTAVPQ